MLVKPAIIAVVLLGTGSADAGRLPISKTLVHGAWECGPTLMKGPQFEMAALTVTKYAPDRTFASTTTSVITPNGKAPITMIDSARGTWRLDGTTLISTLQESKFISSSDETISAAFGQKIQDDQLRKKSIYKMKILELGRNFMRSIPVDSAYPGAIVESKCRRN